MFARVRIERDERPPAGAAKPTRRTNAPSASSARRIASDSSSEKPSTTAGSCRSAIASGGAVTRIAGNWVEIAVRISGGTSATISTGPRRTSSASVSSSAPSPS